MILRNNKDYNRIKNELMNKYNMLHDSQSKKFNVGMLMHIFYKAYEMGYSEGLDEGIQKTRYE